MNLYNIGEFSKMIGKSVSAVRVWGRNGKLVPSYIDDNKNRYYTEKQAVDYLINNHLDRDIEIKIEISTVLYKKIDDSYEGDDFSEKIQKALESSLVHENV